LLFTIILTNLNKIVTST